LRTPSELPLRTTPRQSASEQSRKSTKPIPANEGLLKIALSRTLGAQPSSAGRSSSGTLGATVSSRKLRVALQPDWLPAASCARACQWYVPSASAAGLAVAVPPFDTEPDENDCTSGAHELPAAAELEQSWNSIEPESPGVVSVNVAPSCGSELTTAPSAGAVNAGVAGTTLSIDHVYEAGVASVLPAASVARTSNVCDPSPSPE
jgi:hypothetical protein